MKEEFIELLRSTKRENIEDLIGFIEKTDFFEAPASTRFHGCFEIGHDQGYEVSELMSEKGYKDIRVIKDLVGHDRVVIGEWQGK